jgi:nucleotide-binding universal stress UspA family protein
MIKHVAVALDGSAHAAAAEGLAIALAQRFGAVVHGVHVIDTTFLEGAFITDISGAMGCEPFLNLQAQMRSTLDDVAKVIREEFDGRCQTAGVEHVFHLERNGVAHGILAATKLADLLVVGQRFPWRKADRRERSNVFGTNLAILGMAAGLSWPLSWLIHLPELALVTGALAFVILFIRLLALLRSLDKTDIGALRGYLEFSAVVSKPLEAAIWYYEMVLSALQRKPSPLRE